MKIDIANTYITKLTRANFGDFWRLYKLIAQTMPNKDYLFTHTKKMCKRMLSEPHLVLGVRYNGLLIAFIILIHPTNVPDKQAYRDERLMAVLDAVGVHPLFRGNGLQFLLGKEIEKYAKGMGKFDYIVTTCHPHNIPSLNNFIRLGYKIDKLIYKKKGIPRYVLSKKL